MLQASNRTLIKLGMRFVVVDIRNGTKNNGNELVNWKKDWKRVQISASI
jgi:hypothetical protein